MKEKEKVSSIQDERTTANYHIIRILSEYMGKHTGIRFHQMLQNLGIETPMTDQFYEESTKTLEKAKLAIDKR